MDKLNYESLYKFLVSIGLALITLPFIVVGLMYGIDPTLISQENYDALSQYSKDELSSRENIRYFIESHFYYVYLFVIIGLFLVVIGVVLWVKAHKMCFKMEELNIQNQELSNQKILNDLHSMSENDVKKEISEEVENDEELKILVTLEDSQEDSNVGPNKHPYGEEDRVLEVEDHNLRVEKTINKYIQVENAFFTMINTQLGEEYDCKHNVRPMNSHIDSMDILAVSKTDKPDLIYEIKYYKDFMKNISSIGSSILRVWAAKDYYEKNYGRKAKVILAIVTDQKVDEKYYAKVERLLVNPFDQSQIEVQYMTIEQLGLKFDN